jgi:hypothetical protein
VDLLVDLHNHSCLSPCGSLEMSPARLVAEAAARGIGALGLTDHNSALNCPAFEALCLRAGIVPVCGIEAMPREEVHLLCLFGSAAAAAGFGARLRELLPPGPFDPLRLGDQPIVDEEENVLGFEERYLGAALDIGLDGLCELALGAGALLVPAHVDRPMFSMRSQLGFLPEGPWTAVELRGVPPAMATGPYPRVSASDAHHPADVGRRPFRLRSDRAMIDLEGIARAIAAGGASIPGE